MSQQRTSFRLCYFFLLLGSAHLTPAADHLKYRHSYFHSEEDIQKALTENCSSEYQVYLQGGSIKGCKGCYVSQLTNCVLSSMGPVWIADTGAAAVVLGLLPTVLSLAGSNTVEMGLLTLRRPLLAVLLAVGSPATNPIRAFDYRDPKQILEARELALGPPRLDGVLQAVVLALEYIVALGSATNIILASWTFGVQTVCSFSQETSFGPMFWVLLSIAVHALGAVAVGLRVSLQEHSGEKKSKTVPMLRALLSHEMTLCSSLPATKLTFEKETIVFVFVAWLTSTATIAYLLYGTPVFSSALYVKTVDAAAVVAQFLASTIVCRFILAFELSGLRARVSIK